MRNGSFKNQSADMPTGGGPAHLLLAVLRMGTITVAPTPDR